MIKVNKLPNNIQWFQGQEPTAEELETMRNNQHKVELLKQRIFERFPNSPLYNNETRFGTYWDCQMDFCYNTTYGYYLIDIDERNIINNELSNALLPKRFQLSDCEECNDVAVDGDIDEVIDAMYQTLLLWEEKVLYRNNQDRFFGHLKTITDDYLIIENKSYGTVKVYHTNVNSEDIFNIRSTPYQIGDEVTVIFQREDFQDNEIKRIDYLHSYEYLSR